MVRKLKQTKAAVKARKAYRRHKKHGLTHAQAKKARKTAEYKRLVKNKGRVKAYRPRNGKPKAFKYVLRNGTLHYAGKTQA